MPKLWPWSPGSLVAGLSRTDKKYQLLQSADGMGSVEAKINDECLFLTLKFYKLSHGSLFIVKFHPLFCARCETANREMFAHKSINAIKSNEKTRKQMCERVRIFEYLRKHIPPD